MDGTLRIRWLNGTLYSHRDATLLGDSGGVVNSLDFYLVLLKSLGCFYFRCVLSSQWNSEFANFTLPTLKAFLEARSHNVFGNKQ